MIDQFFITQDLSFECKRNILIKAKSFAYNWWVDILDCSKSITRKKIEMSFDEILNKFVINSHFVIKICSIDYNTEQPYLEIGFCTMSDPSYYLWLCLDLKHLPYFINHYDLKLRK